jgi:hypothetical protein
LACQSSIVCWNVLPWYWIAKSMIVVVPPNARAAGDRIRSREETRAAEGQLHVTCGVVDAAGDDELARGV